MNPSLVLGPLLFIAFFLVIRKFWWWYWGIGRMIDALEDIAESLRTLPTVKIYDQQSKRRPPRAA